MKKRNYEGLKWAELTEEEKIYLLKEVNPIDATGADIIKEEGEHECIIDLIYPYSVPGKIKIKNDEATIIIDDNAVIYNPTDIIPVKTIESDQLIEIGMIIRFSELFDGDLVDGNELLEDGTVSLNNENVVAFEIIEKNENLRNTLVKITNIY